MCRDMPQEGKEHMTPLLSKARLALAGQLCSELCKASRAVSVLLYHLPQHPCQSCFLPAAQVLLDGMQSHAGIFLLL